MPEAESAPDRYALVGHPVAHSRSPLIHQLFARQTRQRMTYELIDAEPAQFETAVRGFQAAGGRGMNVTVPHKEAAFALAKTHGEAARIARAVNTLTFTAGAIRGDNTDGIGFIRDVTVNHKREIAGARVLLLGAGGATRGLLGPLLAAKPASLVLANRTVERAAALRDQFAAHGAIDVCSFADLAARGSFDILINATSAGLHGEQPPFPASLVTAQSFCYDLAYSLNMTPFVTWASAQGAGRAVQGWGMLIEQAAESFAIWRGVRPDTAPIRAQLVR
ncbi:MAG TPA: shikimate dehydrogenase [Gammaproteobacteria bacterium]